MFSSPSGGARNRDRSFTKSLSKAALSFVGSGPPMDKQLREAIMEGNEDKAINIYTSSEGGKSLMRSLHVSKPFPSKKHANTDTPLHLTAKFALAKLFVMFLEYGGNPGVRNFRGETCIHSACSLSSNPFRREEIVNVILEWRSKNNEVNATEAVPIDMLDEDGNAGIHLAAHSNLLPCVELLINYGARLNIINKYNYSACEMADKAGFRLLGTMIELAWVFMFVDQQIEDTYLHHKFSADNQIARIVLDSHSLTLTRLVDFINQVIKFTAESIGESSPRAEVMLTHYNWDATKLKKDWFANSAKVLEDVRLQPKSVHVPADGTESPKSPADLLCGIPIGDVYLDSAYKGTGPFSVIQDGRRVQYAIRTYNGKTTVVPTDQDPSKQASLTDPFVSENSHINPKLTEPCSICNDRMFEACSLNHFINGTLVEAKRREFACGSGHKYCFGCWSDHLQSHVLRDGLGCLPCPGSECGEILDLQWAPVMLKSQDLLNRLLAQRQRHVIDCLGLRWCPVSNCGLLVHVAGPGLNKKGDTGFPQTAICANGHAFCLTCNKEAHSPCSCANWALWAEHVREESKNTNSKDPTNISNILLGVPTQKKCPDCGDLVLKEEGCNHMHCRKCRHEFCWICMRDWSMHAENQNGYFQCNRMMDDPSLDGRRDAGEEKDGNDVRASEGSNRARTPKQVLFLHHFSRYQAHGDSMKLEARVMEEAVSRISLGLQAAAEGDIKWLLGDNAPNPYMEKEETEDVFNTMRDLTTGEMKDTVVREYYLPKQECVEFLIDAFEELEKCRCFLKWTYPFALFEFEEAFQHRSSPSHRQQQLQQTHEEANRMQFDLLQAALEASTERLSDIIARRRLRGTKSQIALATRTAKIKRLELEAVVLQSATLHGGSASSSISSWSQDKKVMTGPSVTPTAVSHVGHSSATHVSVESRLETSNSTELLIMSKTPSTGRIQGPPISAFMSPAPLSHDLDEEEDSDEDVAPYQESPPETARRPEPPAEIELNAQDSLAVQRLMSVGFTRDEAIHAQMRQANKPYDPNAVYTFSANLFDRAAASEASESHVESHAAYSRTEVHTSSSSVHQSSQSAQYQQSSSQSAYRTPDHHQQSHMEEYSMSVASQLNQQREFLQQQQMEQQLQYEREQRQYEEAQRQRQAEEQLRQRQLEEQQRQLQFEREQHEQQMRYEREQHERQLQYEREQQQYHQQQYLQRQQADALHQQQLLQQQQQQQQQHRGQVYQYSQHSTSMHSMTQQSMYSEALTQQQVEQRFIGAKKDPDSEALEHAILLSQQESEFGVNMYDALTPADEPVIDEYVAQGFTREEAILIIYEEKYGKVSVQRQSNVTPAMPTVYNTIADEVHVRRTEEDEAEIIQLMARGYTREQACNKIDFDRERAAAAHQAYLRRQSSTVGQNLLSTPVRSQHGEYPEEEEEVLTAAESHAVDELLRTGRYVNPADAIDEVLRRRVTAESHSQSTHHMVNHHAGRHMEEEQEEQYEDDAHLSYEERQIVALMRLGYSRDQARSEYERRNAASRQANSRATHVEQKDADQLAIDDIMARGYSLDQATQMHYQAKDNRENARHGFQGDLARVDHSRQGYAQSEVANSQSQFISASRSDAGDRNYHRGGGGRDRDRERDRDYDDYAPSEAGRSDYFNASRSDAGGREMRRANSRGENRYARSEAGERRERRTRRSEGGLTRGNSGREFRGGRERSDSFNRSGSYYPPPNNGASFRSEAYSDANSEADDYFDARGPPPRESFGSRPAVPPLVMSPPPAAGGGARNADELAVAMALLISQQEAEFGINMYDSLTPADQPEIDGLTANGYTADEAIQLIFERRYRPRGGGAPPSARSGGYNSARGGPRDQPLSRSGSGGSDYGGFNSSRSPQAQQSPDYYSPRQDGPPSARGESSFFRASSMVGRTGASPARSNSGGFEGDRRRYRK